jgi:hypothetical protein
MTSYDIRCHHCRRGLFFPFTCMEHGQEEEEEGEVAVEAEFVIFPVLYIFLLFSVSRESPVRVWGTCTPIWTGAVRLMAPVISLLGWQHGPLRVTLSPYECINITGGNFTWSCTAVRVYVGIEILNGLCGVPAIRWKGDWRSCIRVCLTTRASRQAG